MMCVFLEAAESLGNTDFTNHLIHNTSFAPRVLQQTARSTLNRPGSSEEGQDPIQPVVPVPPVVQTPPVQTPVAPVTPAVTTLLGDDGDERKRRKKILECMYTLI